MELKNKIQNIRNQLFSLLSQFKLINSKSFIRIPLDINKMIIGENKLKLYSNKLISKIEADDLYGVTSISQYAFSECNSLTSVTIPDSVTSIGKSAFSECNSLASVTIGNSVTSIGDSAFYRCTSLASINIGNSVTSIGQSAFLLTDYYKNASNWENNVLYIGKYLIEAKDSFSESYIIKDNTKAIANGAFQSCSSLESITIPDSVTSIGDSTFKHCGNLTSVTIPDSVTSIGQYAFSGCSSLTRVTIPDSVTSIGQYAFSGCNSRTRTYWIYLKSTTPPTLGNSSAIDITTWIIVPIGSGDAYKNATNWAYHANYIIEDTEI